MKFRKLRQLFEVAQWLSLPRTLPPSSRGMGMVPFAKSGGSEGAAILLLSVETVMPIDGILVGATAVRQAMPPRFLPAISRRKRLALHAKVNAFGNLRNRIGGSGRVSHQ